MAPLSGFCVLIDIEVLVFVLISIKSIAGLSVSLCLRRFMNFRASLSNRLNDVRQD